ncbi:hypothetical protein [Kyrpidia tusciae]|uniref:Uncharacterized protein n=1 Tax=Kyrpidia tusciae (strain DSM 2912 / NBRC 15312 / T2) TaxID=562970 RepID=D5WTT7_KYRT2|nr:hypothetical protein [Kyrpidia tusciae]ADG05257.1 hypothetical protein Btus_0489 [Kyrpidia tusciae DSM 2912]MBE3552287.1 hypothetical protein [Kyrpidia tusciae]
MNPGSWTSVELPPDARLLRKETFTLQMEQQDYDIELFETMEGEYYAMGTPRATDKIIVYGSPVVPDAALALQIVIDKIQRDQVKE